MFDTYMQQLKSRIQDNAEFSALYDELVPMSGKCDSLAGEMVRAIARIGYRFFNDGDWLNVGYGIETVNPAARFLLSVGDDNVRAVIAQMCEAAENEFQEMYLELLSDLQTYTCKSIAIKPELLSIETEDMLKCKYHVDFLYDSVDEYECWDEDDDDDCWDDDEEEW